MKKRSLLLAVMVALLPALAHGYSSQAGVDPSSTPEVEKKSVRQDPSSTSTLAAGLILSYTSVNDGYTITKAGAATAIGSRLIACVSTGSTIASAGATSQCVTKGFVRGVSFATVNGQGISIGEPVCADANGKGVNCNAAASSSHVISLNLIAPNATAVGDVLINSR